MRKEQLPSILFIDIETAPIEENFEKMSERMQDLWMIKSKNIAKHNNEDIVPERTFKEKAGIYSEFSKVVCIGIGSLVYDHESWQMRLKSFSETDEKNLLNNFLSTLQRFQSAYPSMVFCGHNIKEFDLPFLCRRMIINDIEIPLALQIQNKKPWEISHLDTRELGKLGDFKHYTSLELLSAALDIPSPKSDIDGSQVATLFWQEKDYERIAKYCLTDVLTTAKVYLRLSGKGNLHFDAVYL